MPLSPVRVAAPLASSSPVLSNKTLDRYRRDHAYILALIDAGEWADLFKHTNRLYNLALSYPLLAGHTTLIDSLSRLMDEAYSALDGNPNTALLHTLHTRTSI